MTTETTEQFETKSVKTIRGLEARTTAKQAKEGWEFVSQTTGTVRSELHFRRPKPKTPWKTIGLCGGAVALLVILLILIIVFAGDDKKSDEAGAISSPKPAQTTSPKPSIPPADPAPTNPSVAVTDITVDDLLDSLNSAEMGGFKTGDQFRITGELFLSEYWMTGASGDFSVLLKAQGGAQDLMVFVDEEETATWKDGTVVEMIVDMVEVTIHGETTDGWLSASSAKVLP